MTDASVLRAVEEDETDASLGKAIPEPRQGVMQGSYFRAHRSDLIERSRLRPAHHSLFVGFLDLEGNRNFPSQLRARGGIVEGGGEPLSFYSWKLVAIPGRRITGDDDR